MTIPEGVTKIGSYAFKDCQSLKEIHLPAGLTLIGKCAFIGCIALEQIYIPQNVKEIGWRTFTNCPNLLIICETKQSCAWEYAKEHRIKVMERSELKRRSRRPHWWQRLF